MLDIRYIREHPEEVAEKAKQKGYAVDVKKLLTLDEKRRTLIQKIEENQATINNASKEFQNSPPNERQRATLRQTKAVISDFQDELEEIEGEYWQLLKSVPNMPADDVPVGVSETENKVAKEWGDKPKFDFEPKTHWQIAEERGLIDKERAAKVAGSRFAYLKGDLVKMQFALIQFTIDKLTDSKTLAEIAKNNGLDVAAKPFIPVLPPYMLKTEIYDAMDRLEPREERYKVGSDEDDLWLEGSAEHTLGPMHAEEILDLADLPLRYLGYATSFRREAGSYGKDTEGIIRMHQFDKLEMESFVNPEGGELEHLFFVAIQEYLMQQLEIPYRVLLKCTADIGKPNARGIDLEAWLPGQNKYMETHTADFMTDYQARRLGTRTKMIPPKGVVLTYDATNPPTVFVHTNDATAFALGRTMIAIIENFQDGQGKVSIPKELQPYMGGQTDI